MAVGSSARCVRFPAMLGEEIPHALPTSLVVAVDTFGFADANVAAALQPMVQRLAALIGHNREDIMAPQGLSVWARAQRSLQPVEAWNTFKDWLERHYPLKAKHVMSRVHQMRAGRDNDPCFGSRMRGTGELADLLQKRFDIAAKRIGFNSLEDRKLDTTLFRVPGSSQQMSLF